MTTLWTDDCNRTAGPNGLGTSSDGHTYTLVTNGSYLSVDGSAIRATFAGSGNCRFVLAGPALSQLDQHIEFDIVFSALPASSTFNVRPNLRYIDVQNTWQPAFAITSSGQVQVINLGLIGNVQTISAAAVTVATGYTPGTVIHCKAEIIGANPATLRLKAWVGSTEPPAWTVETTATSTDVPQVAGNVGFNPRQGCRDGELLHDRWILATDGAAAAQTVSPTGIASAGIFGTPAISRGPVTVSPTGIASGGALGSPTVGRGPRTVNPAGIASAGGLGNPTLGRGPVTVSPDGIATGGALGSERGRGVAVLRALRVVGAYVSERNPVLEVKRGAVVEFDHLDGDLFVNEGDGAIIARLTVTPWREGDAVVANPQTALEIEIETSPSSDPPLRTGYGCP